MYINRELEMEIKKGWEAKHFLVIDGPRQAGKTTLLKKLQKEWGGTYLSLEDPALAQDFSRNPLIVKDLEEPIFIDEVQYLKDGRPLKRLADEGIKAIVSGSGAFETKLGLKGYLVGRALFYTLLPFSLAEFAQARNTPWRKTIERSRKKVWQYIKGKSRELPLPMESIHQLAKEYLIWGGYPEPIVKWNYKEVLLANIVRTTIEQDIIRYFSLREGELLWEVVKELATRMSQLTPIQSLEINYKTAWRYLSALSYGYIIKLVSSWVPSVKSRKKVYFYDNGFRNTLIKDYRNLEIRQDYGPLVENVIFRALWNLDPKYWRKGQAEVDFVINTSEGLIGIEVKGGKGRITPSVRSFIRKEKPWKVIITTNSKTDVQEVNGTEVLFIPFYFL